MGTLLEKSRLTFISHPPNFIIIYNCHCNLSFEIHSFIHSTFLSSSFYSKTPIQVYWNYSKLFKPVSFVCESLHCYLVQKAQENWRSLYAIQYVVVRLPVRPSFRLWWRMIILTFLGFYCLWKLFNQYHESIFLELETIERLIFVDLYYEE